MKLEIFLLLLDIFLVAPATRVKRQIFYNDIPVRPQQFRSNAEEKERAAEETERTGHLPLAPEYPADFSDVQFPPNSLKHHERPIVTHSDHPRPFSHKPLGKPLSSIKQSNPHLKPHIPPSKPAVFPPSLPNSHKDDKKPHAFHPDRPAAFTTTSFGSHKSFRKPHNSPPKNPVKFIRPKPHTKTSRPKRPPPKHHTILEEPPKGATPGIPGEDYPIYREVPPTSFSCDKVPYRPGMYANPEAHCQAYHVCHDDRHGPQGASFLCTNGTLFNQESFSCDWWYNVDCSKARSFYQLNNDPKHNPYYKKPHAEQRKDFPNVHTKVPAKSLSRHHGSPSQQFSKSSFSHTLPKRMITYHNPRPKSPKQSHQSQHEHKVKNSRPLLHSTVPAGSPPVQNFSKSPSHSRFIKPTVSRPPKRPSLLPKFEDVKKHTSRLVGPTTSHKPDQPSILPTFEASQNDDFVWGEKI